MITLRQIRLASVSSLAVFSMVLPPIAQAAANAVSQSCAPIVSFDQDHFSNPTQIDNQYLPLIPGRKLVLTGRSNAGGRNQSHRVEFVVTDLTKVIHGVETVAVWDTDFDGSQIAETELSFFAQDDAGNVWNLGEYPEEYNKGKFVGAPSTWMSGVAGAVGGIHMLAKPRVTAYYYNQGRSATIDFLDCARVTRMGGRVCVPISCYSRIVETAEKSPLDPKSGIQLKYHASNIGIVKIGALGDPQAETLVLTAYVKLSPAALAQARKAACNLDKRGYRISAVYRATTRAQFSGRPCY